MKLMHCVHCKDIVLLTLETRPCLCGRSKGHYESDGWHAAVSPDAVVIGLSNPSFHSALFRYHAPKTEPDPTSGPSPYPLEAFLIPHAHPRVDRSQPL